MQALIVLWLAVLMSGAVCQFASTPHPTDTTNMPADKTATMNWASPTIVRVGILGNAADVPFHLAKEKGYLAEEGLDLDTVAFDSAQRMIAPLGADQLDVGYGAMGPGLVNAVARGVNIHVVAGQAQLSPGLRFTCVVVRKDLLDSGAVHAFVDMRGKTFAEPVPGNIITYLFEKELRAAGVHPSEVNYITVPFPDVPAAFANRVMDVATSVEPFNTLMEERGIAQCWKPAGDIEPNFQVAVLLYGPAFVEQRSEAAKRFMVAYLRAARDYTRALFGDGQGRAELIDLLVRTTPVKDPSIHERIAPIWIDPNGDINLASLRAVQRWYVERGDQSAEVDLTSLVDRSYLDYALGRLGRY